MNKRRHLSIPKQNITDPDLLEALSVIERHAASSKDVEENTIPRPRNVRSTVPHPEEGQDGDLDLYIDEEGHVYLAMKVNGRWRKTQLEEF